jgi:hypothetical protein
MSVAGAVQGGSDFIDATRDGALQGDAPGARSTEHVALFRINRSRERRQSGREGAI